MPMEKNNITEKLANPRDARQSLVGLSDVGRTLYNDAYVTFVHSCTSAFSLLDESEIDMLLHLLNKINLFYFRVFHIFCNRNQVPFLFFLIISFLFEKTPRNLQGFRFAF